MRSKCALPSAAPRPRPRRSAPRPDGWIPFASPAMSIGGFSAARWPAGFQDAILLLFVPAMFLADEHTRLLAYGVIVAGTFAFAFAIASKTLQVSLMFTVIGVLLLRWIPFSQVIVWRGLIVLLCALAGALGGHARRRPPH